MNGMTFGGDGVGGWLIVCEAPYTHSMSNMIWLGMCMT